MNAHFIYKDFVGLFILHFKIQEACCESEFLNLYTYVCKFDPLNTLLKWCEGFVARIILPFKRSFCGGPPMRTAWTPDISESIVITASTPNKRVTPFTVMVHLANILNCV